VSAVALRPSFWGLVRAELRKLAQQRSTWVMLLLAVGIFAVVALALIASGSIRDQLQHDPTQWFLTMLQILYLIFATGSGIFLLIVSARSVAMEYAGGTIRVLLGRGVGRLQLLFAKLAALLVTGVALMVGFALVAGGLVVVLVWAWTGSLSDLTALAAEVRHALLSAVGASLVSVVVTILLGSVAGVLGRSQGFALGFALGLFPADNFGVIILALLNRATGQKFWNDISQWLLGPNLNFLLKVWEPHLGIRIAFGSPLVPVSSQHVEVVVAAWALAFLLVSMLLTSRRDVLE